MRMQASIVGASLLLVTAAWAAPERSEIEVQNAEGTVLGKLVICADCKDPAAKGAAECAEGAVEGWREGTVCGSCLLRSNWGVLIEYDRDIHINGKLIAPDGNPVGNRFVKLFMPNGWSVRTRTAGDGTFRLMLGATLQRKGGEPFVVDIGRRVDSVVGTDEHFGLYFLPPNYKSCPATEPTPGGTPLKQGAF